MTPPLGLGLIGCGPRALRGHLPSLRDLPDVRLVAVCDLDEALAGQAASQSGAVPLSDHHALLARADVEAVLVVTATPFHARLAADALDAGKHVLLEKPLAASATEAADLCRRASERGLVGAVGYQSRFNPHMRWLWEQATEVEPVQILIDRPRGMMAPAYLRPGAHFGIMDYISHDLDLAAWLMGAGPRWVSAVLQRGIFGDSGAIESASVRIEFDDAAPRRVATVVSSMGGAGLPTRYQVVGRGGSALLSGSEGILSRQHAEPGSQTGYRAEVRRLDLPGPGGAASTAAMHAAFASVVRGSPCPALATFADGLAAMRLHEAIVEADRSSTRVRLD